MRPSAALFALEGFRAVGELGARVLAEPMLRGAPKGDGHPVLVLPGLAGSDVSTRVMRGFLRRLGYHVHAWRLGRNWGPTDTIIDGLVERFGNLTDEHGRRLTLVGHSLGGIYAREMARAFPNKVRQVITLGSPVQRRPGLRSNAAPLYRALSGLYSERTKRAPRGDELHLPAGVPVTAILTRTDGVVDWRGCTFEAGPKRECVVVPGSHSGLIHNPVTLMVVADRLAQPEGRWEPFVERRGLTARRFPADV